MSYNKTNDSFQKTENENSKNNKYDEELLIKYTNEIKNEETRSQAIENLYKYREENKNIAIYLWYSRGTMAALLQEITNIYQYITTSKLTTENSNKAKYRIKDKTTSSGKTVCYLVRPRGKSVKLCTY